MTKRYGAAQADHAEQIPPLDFFAMLRVLWHGKWLVLCTMLLMVGLAGYYAFRIAQPKYAATATLQLDITPMPLPDVTQQQMTAMSDTASLNTKVALVTSDTVLADVVMWLDLLADPEFNRYLVPIRPLALSTLRTNLRHFLAGTTAESPTQAAILEKTIQNLRGAITVTRQPDTYILQITARSGRADKARQVANTVAARYLAHTQDLRRQSGESAILWLEDRLTELRQQLETQEMHAASMIATAQIQDDSGLDTLSAQVLATDQRLSEARNTLAMLEIAPESGSARNTAAIAQLRNEISDIAALKGRLSAQLSSQSAGLAQLHQIELQADATRMLYQTFLSQLQKARMEQGLTPSSAQRIAPAGDGQYIGPQKIPILVTATILGAALGVILVALQHTTRTGVIDARSLRDATGLPVLAQISAAAMRGLRKSQSPKPALSNAARSLHTAMTLAAQGKPTQVIMTTSSFEGEGKTTQALALAHAVAKAGKLVVVIGADEKNLTLKSVLGSDRFAAAQDHWPFTKARSHDDNLDIDILVLPSLTDQQGPLLGDQLVDLLTDMRSNYDYIIIDAPPVQQATEARLIATLSDTILYCVRWAKTPLDVVQSGLGALEDVGHPATGLILSQVNMRKMRKLSVDPCVSAMRSAPAT